MNCFPSGIFGKYTNHLINELEQNVKEWGIRYFPTIYLGGGTPSLFPVNDLVRLFKKINLLSVESPIECTFELNPESLTKRWLMAVQEIGANRFSCGIQTLNRESRRLINRKGDPEQLLETISLLKNTGADLNFDLINGLPAQSEESLIHDLKVLLDYSPQHLSYYDLSIEPATELGKKIARGEIILSNEDWRDEMWETGKKYIHQRGYRRYEISAYCREGNESIHNSRYWEMKPWLGIGAGAASSLRTGSFHIKRRNDDNINAFLAGARGTWIQQDSLDTASEIIMMGLRTCKGFDLNDLKDYLPSESLDRMSLLIDSMIQQGYLVKEMSRISPKERGMNFHSHVTMALFESIK